MKLPSNFNGLLDGFSFQCLLSKEFVFQDMFLVVFKRVIRVKDGLRWCSPRVVYGCCGSLSKVDCPCSPTTVVELFQTQDLVNVNDQTCHTPQWLCRKISSTTALCGLRSFSSTFV